MKTMTSERPAMPEWINMVKEDPKCNDVAEMSMEEIDAEIALYRTEERAKERTRRDRETRLNAIAAVSSMREKAERCGLSNMTMEEIDAEIALWRAGKK